MVDMHLVEVQQHLRDLQSGGSATQSRFSSRLGGDSNLGSSYQSELTDGSDKLFVFPVLTTSTSATFNLTLNPATASTKVKKITLLLKQQIGVATDTDDYDITLAASSWTRGQVEDINEPLIIGTISPESLPESHENYYEPIVQWVEYDLSPLLLEKPLGQRNLVVINSQWRKISLAYLRVEYDDIQVSCWRTYQMSKFGYLYFNCVTDRLIVVSEALIATLVAIHHLAVESPFT